MQLSLGRTALPQRSAARRSAQQAQLRLSRRSLIQRAVEDKTTAVEVDDCAENTAGDYCSIDAQARRQEKRTVGEMEAQFIEALTSFYYDGKSALTVRRGSRDAGCILPQARCPWKPPIGPAAHPPSAAQDEEFDLLKEELLWNGSKVAVLDSNEQRFLEAQRAYAAVSDRPPSPPPSPPTHTPPKTAAHASACARIVAHAHASSHRRAHHARPHPPPVGPRARAGFLVPPAALA